jgi:hypothetical protein
MTKHRKQWLHNRDLLAHLDHRFPDWAVTAAFYAALHAIDVLLEHDKVSPVPTSHEQRRGVLQGNNRYKEIFRCFDPLYGLSRTVRYMAEPAQWVPWDEIDSKVLRRFLYPIEKSVRKLSGGDELPLVSMQRRPPVTASASAGPGSTGEPIPARDLAPARSPSGPA